jgi:hypothetical protein
MYDSHVRESGLVEMAGTEEDTRRLAYGYDCGR